MVLDSGHTVTGEMGTDVDWGEHLETFLDDIYVAAAAGARERGDEQIAERWERWREVPESKVGFGRVAAHRNAEEERVRERTIDTPTNEWGKTDWDQIADDDLAELVIRLVERRRMVTITSASVAAPSGGPFEKVQGAGLIRIEVGHVAAWYPGRSDG